MEKLTRGVPAVTCIAFCALGCALFMAWTVLLSPVAGAVTYHRYFGDLHNHTSDIDALGTPAEAYAAAKAGGADFLAVTDHTDGNRPLTDAKWQGQRAAAAAATSGDFAALNGYEVTMPWGHVNVFDPSALPTEAEQWAMEEGTVASLYDWLVLHPTAVAQWNPPTHKSDEFDDFAGLTPQRSGIMGALEIANEGFRYESSYVKALDAGWKVMPTANADMHTAQWITGFPNRTVLLAEELTPAALLDALREHHGYATVVKDLRVSFRGNGRIIGNTLAVPRRIRFTVRVLDPRPRRAVDRLRWVAIVSDGGKVVARKRCSGYSVDWRCTIDTAKVVKGGAHYFFLQVTNGSGRVAWTAPIWTGR